MADSIGCEVGTLFEVDSPVDADCIDCDTGPGAGIPSRDDTVINGLKVTFFCVLVAEDRDVVERFKGSCRGSRGARSLIAAAMTEVVDPAMQLTNE